jgi:poly(beta-D-mannuronate) C5 epimerase
MRHHRLVWLYGTLLAGSLLFTGPASAEEARAPAGTPQELYLQGKQAEGAAAVPYWEALLAQKPAMIANGVTLETVRLNLVNDLIKAAEQSRQSAYYIQAAQAGGSLAKPRERAWSYVLILRSQLLNDQPRLAAASYADALALLPQLTNSEDYSHVANGLVQALLAPKDGLPIAGRPGVEKANMLAGFIATAQPRAEAMRSIAVAELQLEGGLEVKESLAGTDSAAQSQMLIARANERAQSGALDEALRLALALPFTHERNRDDVLLGLKDQALKAGDYRLAVKAVSGIQKGEAQGQAMVALAKALVEKKELTRADRLATRISDPQDAADAYRMLARAYQDMGYIQRANAAADAMLVHTAVIKDEVRRADAYASAATFFAEIGETGRAGEALVKAEDSSHLMEAQASMARKLAEKGKISEAREYYEEAEDATSEIRSRAAGAIAEAMAEQGYSEDAMDFLEGEDGLGGEDVRRAQIAIVKSYLARNEKEEAEEFMERLSDPAALGEAQALLARHRHLEGDEQGAAMLFEKAIATVSASKDATAQSQAKVGIVEALAEAGRFKQATALFEGMQSEEHAQAASRLIAGMAAHDSSERALDYALKISDGPSRDAALVELSRFFAEQQNIRLATKAAKQISAMTPRVRAFRQVAEIQARFTDFYGLLQNKGASVASFRAVQTGKEEPMILPASLPAASGDEKTFSSFEEGTIDLIRHQHDDVLMRDAPLSSIGQKLPNIKAKEQLSYDTAYVRTLVPKSSYFHASRAYYQNSPYNLKFHFAAGNADFVRRQGMAVPDMISIERGVVDLALLHDYLEELGLGKYLERMGERTYILRRPLVIGPNATLVISGADTEELRLSQEAGAYIVNAGTFFSVDTKITAWSEKNNRAPIVDKEPHEFRPFYATWSRSVTNMANTDFTAFGYTNSKSYGLSISSGPRQFEKMQSRDYKRPTGVIVDNSFRNFLYGFYSYEADNVVLVGNEYVDNYTYGVDPHDRSRWLLIAYNTAYDTHKKHGIIISREVNFSTILGNVTFDNHGSGLMIDRFSTGTMIYANTSFENGGDGLTVFESSCKLIASNRLFENKRAGIRVRNSMDVGIFFNEIRGNRQAAVQGYVADLKNDPAHRHRDFELDPYTDVTGISMVGNWIERNGVGIMGTDIAALYLRGNRFQAQSPKLLRGTWEKSAPRIFSSSQIEGDGLFITNRCVKGTIAVRHHCGFRDDGYFPGDGQDTLVQRIDEDYCETPIQPAQSASNAIGDNS